MGKDNILELKDFEIINSHLASKLKQARTDKKLSVAKLSQMSGIASDYISRVENGKKNKVSLYIYLKLMYYLDINPESFVSDIKNLPPFTNRKA